MNQMFAQVVDNKITKLNQRRGKIKGLGKLSPDSTYIQKGYYPITGSKPAVSPETHRVQGPKYVLEGLEVKRVYEVVEIPQEELTEKLMASIESSVQTMLDTQAKELGYDSIMTAVTYADDLTIIKFQTEGTALRAWRSLCWAKCYELIAAGEVLTVEEVMAQMPQYGEGV